MEIFAGLVFVSITVLTIYLAVSKKIEKWLTRTLLVFALSAFAVIVIAEGGFKKLNLFGVKFEDFEKDVNTLTETKMEEVTAHVMKAQKEVNKLTEEKLEEVSAHARKVQEDSLRIAEIILKIELLTAGMASRVEGVTPVAQREIDNYVSEIEKLTSSKIEFKKIKDEVDMKIKIIKEEERINRQKRK